MSEKKEVKKTEKPGFFTRAKNWIVALPGRIAGAFKNMASELKKVAWPSKKDLINYSVVVIAFVVALAIIVGLLDTGSSFLVKKLIAL
ncbi:MAG: preprotein translocase subunit SecE [Clostridiales bacterium]|nr:preprotein translocase subunit SecE [Clostridiales bacterium]MDD7173489.1 preprotein translocase subunit SecE [Clostridiales bacterium]MDY5349348.1 preprotein translocase subunit SecE [Candidatus Ventricola sp.]MDY5513326.1 preprotein translocase subunit SecE [Candidatus Ventricola sp.]